MALCHFELTRARTVTGGCSGLGQRMFLLESLVVMGPLSFKDGWMLVAGGSGVRWTGGRADLPTIMMSALWTTLYLNRDPLAGSISNLSLWCKFLGSKYLGRRHRLRGDWIRFRRRSVAQCLSRRMPRNDTIEMQSAKSHCALRRV
jgi:hypothetical protein